MYNEKGFGPRLKIFMIFGFVPLFAFLTVMVIPFLLGIFMTFTDWNGVAASFHMVGLDNFTGAAKDSAFWHSLGLTSLYVLLSVLLTNAIAFGLALLVTSGIKGQNAYRVGFFTPNLIGGVILGFIWQFLFSRVFVTLGHDLHLPFLSDSWLSDPTKALWALVIVGVWQSAGYMMLIYIAGITGISDSVLEASQIDGASRMRQLFSIKIPLMVSSFTISLFLTISRSFMVYDTNLSLTKGGPYRATELITMHIYNEAFVYQNYGTGQAKAILLFVIVAIIAVSQVVITKRLEVAE